jgi:pimeloyl-ACP methyl ester carboxylesterase
VTVGARPALVDTGAIRLSGICAAPSGDARGLILALHGGSYSAGYWDCPSPGASLLELGAALGFHILAVDRPGYGASHDHDPARLHLVDQVEFLFGALDAYRASIGFAGPRFVIGHSIGGILALLMAAHRRGAELVAVDVLGVPVRFPDTAAGAEVNSWTTEGTHVAAVDETQRRWLLFGPDGSYDQDAYDYDATLPRPMPVAEYRDALAIPARWPEILPAIRIPVQFTLAEHEVMQATGPEALAEISAMLSGSAHPMTFLQRGTGHNASIHRIARAYHLRALSFFEESLALRR